jgi:hypothetical protein
MSLIWLEPGSRADGKSYRRVQKLQLCRAHSLRSKIAGFRRQMLAENALKNK